MGKKDRKSMAPAAAAPDASRLFDQTKKAIFEGARQGHLDLVLALFSKMEKSQAIRAANSRNEDSQSPLHLSCANGHTDVARYLLECKSNANYRDAKGCTPVLYAARSAAWDTCELLLTVPKYLDVEGADHVRASALPLASPPPCPSAFSLSSPVCPHFPCRPRPSSHHRPSTSTLLLTQYRLRSYRSLAYAMCASLAAFLEGWPPC